MDEVLAEAIKAALGVYPKIRKAYYEEVFSAVYDYLDGTSAMTSYKNAMIRSVGTAFPSAGDAGWEDGGQALPIDADVSEWIAVAQETEIANINMLFQNLKNLRQEKGEDFKLFDYASQRAEGYASTLDRIYSYVKIASGKNIMLTLVGEDGTDSCDECKRYKGKRHRASWWVKNNLVPGIGSAYSCGGWRCQHTLVDDGGSVWSL